MIAEDPGPSTASVAAGIRPLDVFLKILATWGQSEPAEDQSLAHTSRRHLADLAPFQLAGARKLLQSLGRFGGVLLCDSPGLGKTHVALAVAGELWRSGSRSLFVLPAALRQFWRRAARDAGVPFRSISHEALCRRTDQPSQDRARLIIVDEAHAFRNASVEGHDRLAGLCKGRKVLLVTATPINNEIGDLYNQLRLFTGDTTFACLGVPDLRSALESSRSAGLDGRRVLEAVMVRRDCQVLETDGASTGSAVLRKPRCQRSQVRLDWMGEAKVRSGELLRLLDSRREAGGLLACLLAKRLASSPRALMRTLQRLLASNRLGWGKAGSSLQDTLLREMDEDGGVQALLPGIAPPGAPQPTRGPSGLPGSLDSPWLQSLIELCRLLLDIEDPKVHFLRRLALDPGGPHRIVVFTEYKDTARFLFDRLKDLSGVARLDGEGGQIGEHRVSRERTLDLFAPLARGCPEVAEGEGLRLLIATDVLSEGLNLQDADCVVSYDLPWNPVRLLQREGRIDRIGSPHESVRLVRLLPDSRLDHLLKLSARLQDKQQLAERTLEAPGSPVHIGEQDLTLPAAMDPIGREYRRLRETAPLALGRAHRLPMGLVAATASAFGEEGEALACFRVRSSRARRWDFRFLRISASRVEASDTSEALETLRRASGSGGLPGRVSGDRVFRNLDRAARELLREARSQSVHADRPSRRLGRLIRRIQQEQRRCRGLPKRLSRLERLERWLCQPIPRGLELEILRVTRESAGAEGFRTMEIGIEKLFHRRDFQAHGQDRPEVELIGALVWLAQG